MKEAEGLKEEPRDYIYYLYQGDMMNVRERVAYGEKFTENEN